MCFYLILIKVKKKFPLATFIDDRSTPSDLFRNRMVTEKVGGA